LSPEEPEWHGILYQRLRYVRRSETNSNSLSPNVDERTAAWNAYNLSMKSGKKTESSKAHYMQCICEYAKSSKSYAEPLYFGCEIFYGKEAAFEFVLLESK